jgi:HK97 family phage major capsid protein/HK97 family phage prohead protease
MNRAIAFLEIKALTEDPNFYFLEGIATTPTPDKMDDVVEPLGAKFSLPMPLLWQHDADLPVGEVYEANATATGITFKGRMPKVKEAGPLRDRIEAGAQSVKYGLVKGTSIGFRAVQGKVEQLKSGGLRFIEWMWHELSLVTIPANSQATISSIKSLCGPAIGPSVVRLNSPGASGKSIERKENEMTIQERITQWQAKRAATVATIAAIMKAAEDDGDRTLKAEEKTEADAKSAELAEIDDHLKRLDTQLKTVATTAAPVVEKKTDTVKAGDFVVKNNSELPPGIGMARYVKAFAFAKGNYDQAANYAKQWETSTPEVALALKSAVGAGTTTDSVWAGPLVYAQDFPAAFLDYLRPQTIIGKLGGLSRVPFNIRYGIQDGGSTVGWVGQGLPKAVTKLHFTSGSLGFAKAAGIVVITQELARFSSPSAELKVRDDLTAQMVQFLDAQFIDPSVAAVANVSPASVLNGASNVRQAAAAWTSMANVLTDVKVFLSTFAAQEISLQGAYWIMTPDTALSLGLLLNTGGTAFAFPEIDVNGGTFVGLPVIVSNSVPHSTSAGAIVALVVPKHIYLADDGAVAIDSSTEASLQMDSAPGTQDATSGTGTSLVSMFQTNSIAIRVERIINWSRARSYGVGYIDNMHTS